MIPQHAFARTRAIGMAGRRPAVRAQPPASWQYTRWRSPQSLGRQFYADYLRRRHRRHRTPSFDGYVGYVDGMPMFYRRSLWNNGVVLDEPGQTVPPQDEPPPAEPADAMSAMPATPEPIAGPPTLGGVEPASPDQEIATSFAASLDWTPPLPLTAALQRLDGGVYIVERNADPVFVGEASSFARRWALRLEILRQLGVDIEPYRVRLARVAAADPPLHGTRASRLREAIKHTLIRGLLRQGIKLTNRKSIEPFAAGTIALTHGGTTPRYVAGSPAPVAGQSYESW